MTMSRIEQHSAQIDRALACIRQALERGSFYDSGVRLSTLAEAIDQHRAEVNKELDGLRGDVKSAEAAYERVVVEVKSLQQEQDRWTNEQLPGWRKRVTEAEDKLRLMTLDRDDWKRDANLTDDRLENTNRLVGTLKNENDSLRARLDEALKRVDVLGDAYDNQKTLTRNALNESREHVDAHYELKKHAAGLEQRVAELSIVDAESPVDPEFAEVEPFRDTMQKTVFFGDAEHPRTFSPIAIDPGSAEGDKTVISWVCTCGKRKSFEPPKNAYWSTNHKCACGAHLHLSPVGDD